MLPPSVPDAAALLEAAPVALLWVDADGRLRQVNAAARALCGAAAQPGEPLAGLCEEDTEAARLCVLAAATRTLALRHPAGQWVDAKTEPLADGGWLLALWPVPAPQTAMPDDAQSALALAVDLGNIAVWRHDLATNRMHYNAQAYQVLDIPPRPEGLSLDEVRALIHADDLPKVMDSAREAMRNVGPTDMEARYRRADGSWRQVMTRRVLQRQPDGTPQAFIGVALDITARHDQQRQADDMTRRFELATGAAGIGYWVLKRGEQRATWSAPLRELFGLPADAEVPTLDEWVSRHVHPDDIDEVRLHFADWTRSRRESLSMPMRIVRPDGGVRHLSTHSQVERSGPAPLMFGVVVDLTERHNAALALRKVQQRVALAARGAGLGTWELEFETGVAHWDAQMWLLRGHPPQARAMNAEERMACVHPDDRHAVHEQLSDALARGIPFENEFRVVWPDGRLRWLASRSVEVRDDDGARRRIGVNWDITDKRTAEGARREREIALRESQAKSKFLARMSHELRTPLNAVLGFAQLLQVEAQGDDPDTAARRRRIEHIHNAGQHLLELINDVLDLSSLEGGEMRIALQPVTLAPLVEQTLPMLGTLRDRHQVSLQLGALPGCVLADATRLRQVLLNLLTNAIKYNRPGGQVHVEAQVQAAEVVLRVSDTGRGMTAEQLRHLFEPFNRLGRQSEGPEGVEGSGIGLAIVKALVERMGGTVRVSSTPGTGSVFTLRLPNAVAPTGAVATAVAAPVVARPVPAPAPASTAGPGAVRGTLLYVEDNPVNALIISELIARRADLRLHIAPDGASGVRQALELQPDLVLLDMQLPDFDGHEVLRQLRAQPQTAQVPVIALSANAMPEDIERALQAGMSDYWTKPLDFTAFMASLETLFGPPPA